VLLINSDSARPKGQNDSEEYANDETELPQDPSVESQARQRDTTTQGTYSYSGHDPVSLAETLWDISFLHNDPFADSQRSVNLKRIREGNGHAKRTPITGQSRPH
jgi:hypothetical protein